MFRTCLSLAILFLMEITLMAKPRLIVTTDIGGDPDDQQSLVRLLVYANEFDIEALIASASGTPGELGSAFTRPDLIREQIEAYAQVRSNLLLHASGYPTKTYLLDRVKSGNKLRGTANIGSGHDTEGSNVIISVVDKNDARPVNISIWGGQTDLAQALWKVKNSRSSSAYNTFVSRIRVHDIADQDGIFSHIRSNHPGLWYVLDKTRTSNKCSSVFRGMFYQGNTTTVTKTWLRNNIKNNHGALGALYPDEGLWSCGNGINGIKEGDTPSWFYFLDNNLNVPSDPMSGGWGGRFKKEGTNYWRDAFDTVDGKTLGTATVYRWRDEFQNHFRARMDWCVKSRSNANHAPVAAVNYNTQTAESGTVVLLDATGSSDPDGDALSYEWMYYPEAGTYGGSLSLTNRTSRMASFTAPDVTSDKTIHIILKVKDNGTPSLTSYQRVIVTVQKVSDVPPVTALPKGSGRMEAEKMALNGYYEQDLPSASGAKIIRTDNSGSAGYMYDGSAGNYDIHVGCFDENDGSSVFKVYLNGTLIDSWTADTERGSASPDATSAMERIIAGISLARGDTIRIDGTKDTGEFGRVDYIETVPAVTTGITDLPGIRDMPDHGNRVLYDLQGKPVSRDRALPGIYFITGPYRNVIVKEIITR